MKSNHLSACSREPFEGYPSASFVQVVPAVLRLIQFALLAVLSCVATLGQSIPGTLSSTNTSTSGGQEPPCAADVTTTYVWTFTDASGGQHAFARSSSNSVTFTPMTTSVNGHPFTKCVQTTRNTSLDEWSTDGLYFLQATGSSGSITAVSGYLNPKYLIMGVTYAPPGGNANSSVSYANTTFVGNSSTNTSSFSKMYSFSISVCGVIGTGTCGSPNTGSGSILGGLFGFSAGLQVTGSESNAWTYASNNSNTITVSKQMTRLQLTPGTPNVFSPVDHDYDIVWIWLNPIARFTFVPNSCTNNAGCLYWNGYGYDWNDPQHEIDVWPVLVGNLNGDFKKGDGTPCFAIDPTCDPGDADALSRGWVTTQTFASGETAGLSQSDLQTICTHSDPFCSNPGYTVSLISGVTPLTTTDQRFTLAELNNSTPQNIPYKQAAPDSAKGESFTQNDQYSSTTANSQGGSNMYSQGVGLEEKFTGSFFWITGVQVDMKQNLTFTWTNSWQNTVTNTSSQTDIATITGPPCPALTQPCFPAYSEPHNFAVYQDNLYGTFMFWPNPYFTIGVTPGTRTVTAGGSTTFTIPTTANAGYAGTLTSFNVAGLPAGASAAFSPTTGAAGSITPTMTVTTTSSTPAGTYPLAISATDGSLTFFGCVSECVNANQPYATLVVTSAPSFSIAATPSSQTVAIGAGTSYTVSTTAGGGFNGVVNLVVDGLPTDSSAGFSPETVTGSGSSTLSISTTGNTPPGTYPLTINGTSGSLSESTMVNLVVTGANFTLSASPEFQAITPGQSATYTVSVSPVSGFTGTVDLNISTPPSGASATFSSTSISGGSGTSTLTITTTSAIAAGDYNLTVTGTSGALTQTAPITLEIN